MKSYMRIPGKTPSSFLVQVVHHICSTWVQTLRFLLLKVGHTEHHLKEGDNFDILVENNLKMLYYYKMAAINVNHGSFNGTPYSSLNNEVRNIMFTFFI